VHIDEYMGSRFRWVDHIGPFGVNWGTHEFIAERLTCGQNMSKEVPGWFLDEYNIVVVFSQLED
jgi:hypothetical protein